jgi:hypothetical protein
MLRSRYRKLAALIIFAVLPVCGQDMHEHPTPEKLGEVSFPISCQPAVQRDFNRGVALLHSFSYSAADKVFQDVGARDPQCAMAHWGIAMTRFHQLWQPRIAPDAYGVAQNEIDLAMRMRAKTEPERQFVRAAGLLFQDGNSVPYDDRAMKYEHAMSELAAANPKSVETQVFYALALLANAAPSDKVHTRQKQAAQLLEPLFQNFPEHPGIAHYLIHAYDNAQLASQGLPAARLYSKIAPSVPHALHMPSHIFTRLGLWEDSIAGNTAARHAAHRAGDIGEELHTMDYLVYADLQLGRDQDASDVVSQLRSMPALDMRDFKIAYAATAIPIRYAVERADWKAASTIAASPDAPPEVAAAAFWAQSLGFARSGRPSEARAPIQELQRLEQQLQSAGNSYWAAQVRVMKREAMGWAAHAEDKEGEAEALLQHAASEEDSLEKLPVTPGPIIPAREQLATLMLEQGHPDRAQVEFARSLAEAPGRKAGAQGMELALSQARQK